MRHHLTLVHFAATGQAPPSATAQAQPRGRPGGRGEAPTARPHKIRHTRRPEIGPPPSELVFQSMRQARNKKARRRAHKASNGHTSRLPSRAVHRPCSCIGPAPAASNAARAATAGPAPRPRLRSRTGPQTVAAAAWCKRSHGATTDHAVSVVATTPDRETPERLRRHTKGGAQLGLQALPAVVRSGPCQQGAAR